MAEWITRPIVDDTGTILMWSFQIIGELEEIEPFEQLAIEQDEINGQGAGSKLS